MTDQESLPARVRTFLLEPDTFFRQLAEKPARYRWPLAIVLVAGFCYAVASWLEMTWFSSFFLAAYSGAGQSAEFYSSIFGIMVIISSIGGAFIVLVTPLVVGLGFYLLAGFVSKGGSLSHAITATGWGWSRSLSTRPCGSPSSLPSSRP